MTSNYIKNEIEDYRLIFKTENGENLNINHLFLPELQLVHQQENEKTMYQCVAKDINRSTKEITVYFKKYIPKYLSSSELAAKYHYSNDIHEI